MLSVSSSSRQEAQTDAALRAARGRERAARRTARGGCSHAQSVKCAFRGLRDRGGSTLPPQENSRERGDGVSVEPWLTFTPPSPPATPAAPPRTPTASPSSSAARTSSADATGEAAAARSAAAAAAASANDPQRSPALLYDSRVTPVTARVLLDFGVVAPIVAGRSAPRGPQSLRARAAMLRTETTRAQETSARASRRARGLMTQWSVAEGTARKAGQ